MNKSTLDQSGSTLGTQKGIGSSSKLRGNFDEIRPLCFQNRGALAL